MVLACSPASDSNRSSDRVVSASARPTARWAADRRRGGQQQLVIGRRQAEPADLEIPDPLREVGVDRGCAQPGRAVGGVGADVAVEQHQVVARPQFPDLGRRRPAIQGEQQRRSVDRVRQVPQPAVQGVLHQIGMNIDAVPREGHGRNRGAGDSSRSVPASALDQRSSLPEPSNPSITTSRPTALNPIGASDGPPRRRCRCGRSDA